MSETKCSRTGCGKTLRSNNTTGVCGSRCLSMEAPPSQRASGVTGAKGSGGGEESSVGRGRSVMKRFRVVADALGYSSQQLLEDFATQWLDALKTKAEE